MIVGKDFLQTIEGVCCEATGGGSSVVTPTQAGEWCEQWIYEQESIELSDADIAAKMNDYGLSLDDACRELVVDKAAEAWMDSADWVPENYAFSAIVV